MTVVFVAFQFISFLFAISVHESAHAWMANRLGDPTARMLGRITLNPIKHIDLIGTILMPVLAMISGVPLLGWAKPTPVDTRNFKNLVRDDILTSIVGPISNFVVAIGCFLLLALLSRVSPVWRFVVQTVASGAVLDTSAAIMPIVLLLHTMLFLNVLLGIFNLIPIPPLDGSHVLKHFLPESIRNPYETFGVYALWALVLFRVNFLGPLLSPAMSLFDFSLQRI